MSKTGPVIIIFGVSGSGKTTIGQKLSAQLDISFQDADDFHPEANIKKMESGMPLTDDDRFPWLQTLATKVPQWKKNGGIILACSALRESHRRLLTSQQAADHWILLEGPFELIEKRLNKRSDHFMNPDLLQSQFDTLEIPDYCMRIDIEQSPDSVANEIIQKLNLDA